MAKHGALPCPNLQVFRALDKWAKVRPADRQRACATCLAQAAYEAAEASKAAAAAGGTQGGTGGENSSSGSSGSIGDGSGSAGPTGQEPVTAAAAAVARGALEQGGAEPEKCSSCSFSGGYSSLESVLEVPPRRRDKVLFFCC